MSQRRPPPPPPLGGTATSGGYYKSTTSSASSTAPRQNLNKGTVVGVATATTDSSANDTLSDGWFDSTPSEPTPASTPFYSGYSTYNAAPPAPGNMADSNYYGGTYGAKTGISVPPTSAFAPNPPSAYAMSGAIGASMDVKAVASGPVPHIFDPNAAMMDSSHNRAMQPVTEEDYDNEPPLLEELGVNFPHIYSKSRAVLFPYGKHAKNLEHDVMDDYDLAGPLAFALSLGGELLLSGKLHFGYVYGFGISGWFSMTLLLNLLNPNGSVSAWMVVSILGYALLPVNFLAGINVVIRIGKLGWIGMILAILTIGWCTAASTRLFERGCDMRSQRFLVAYPSALLYSAFVMITIF